MKKKLKIAFTINFSHERWLGGSNYFSNLFDAINQHSDHSIIIFTGLDKAKLNPNFKNYKIIYLKVLDNRKKMNILINYLRLLMLILFKRDFIMEKLFNKYKIDILSHSFPLGKYSKIKSIYWVSDLQHLHLKHLFPLKIRFRRWLDTFVAIHNSSIILFSSKVVRKKFLIKFSVNEKKTKVLNFLNRLPVKKPKSKLFKTIKNYFIISNQFWIHKNYDLIIDSLIELKKKNLKPLVISTGTKFDWRSSTYYNNLIKKIKSNKLNNFRILGRVSREEQLYLIMNAKYLINPSKSEGWNSAIEEAKSLNTKVLASNLEVHREQLGSQGIYFDRHNYQKLSKILQKSMINKKKITSYNYTRLYKINSINFRKFANVYKNIINTVIND